MVKPHQLEGKVAYPISYEGFNKKIQVVKIAISKLLGIPSAMEGEKNTSSSKDAVPERGRNKDVHKYIWIYIYKYIYIIYT